MNAFATGESRSPTDDLVRLSPLALLAVAMPWLLEWAIVAAVSTLAPAYEPLVTEGLLDAILYPVVTGSIVLAGLYFFLDPETRRSLFLFRRPSRRELFGLAAAVVIAFVLRYVVAFTLISLLGVEGSTPNAEPELAWIVSFVVTGAVFAPVVEEVLFRGLLLGYLVERGVPRLVAAGVVVAAFGAIHYYGGVYLIVMSATVGAVAVALRLRYDNLVSPVLFHSINNLISGVMLLAALA